MDRDADDECPFVTFQRLPSSDFPTDIDTINILYSITHTFSPFAPSSWIVHCVIIWATYWMSFCKVLKCSTSSFSKVTAFDTIQNRIQACMRPGQCPRYILNFCTCIVTLIISLMISTLLRRSATCALVGTAIRLNRVTYWRQNQSYSKAYKYEMASNKQHSIAPILLYCSMYFWPHDDCLFKITFESKT